jgi:hypothetical protein
VLAPLGRVLVCLSLVRELACRGWVLGWWVVFLACLVLVLVQGR